MKRFSCKAFLFDLDGVLVDSNAVVERAWRRWADRHQMNAEELLLTIHGRRAVETIRDVAPALDVEAEAQWLLQTEIEDIEGLKALDGAADLLASLPPERWAVVTSGTLALAKVRLETCGLPLPRTFVTAEQVRNGKPDPEGYLKGAELLGVDPTECIVFEDAPAGIEAARKAGARVIGITHTYPAAQLQRAHACISTLRALQVRDDGEHFEVQCEDIRQIA
uniref:Glycerol-3-phosphatase n=1 Tax=Thermosporothrix sp. COM3 TaxID=2490863 RepID=A0A455SKN5_9CHLR|nr:glycerol-3-phosphatase [Thermosporothrix sp. COM3]